MQRIYKTHSIILKSMRYGEADNILTVFSLEEGKFSAIAKGVRKTKSKFGSRLEPFSEVKLVLYRGKNLSTITQVDIVQSYKELREDYCKFTYASALVDLTNKVMIDGQVDERIFKFLAQSLKVLATMDSNFQLFLLAFDWKLLSLLGFLPNLEGCSCPICQQSGRKKQAPIFSLEDGGLVCNQAASTNSTILKLAPYTSKILRSIIKTELAKVVNLEVDSQTLKQLQYLTEKFLTYQLQTDLRSRNFLV